VAATSKGRPAVTRPKRSTVELAEVATKGRSISAAVALLSHPAKRTLKANGPQWWAGLTPTDKPGRRTCPSHREMYRQDNTPIG